MGTGPTEIKDLTLPRAEMFHPGNGLPPKTQNGRNCVAGFIFKSPAHLHPVKPPSLAGDSWVSLPARIASHYYRHWFYHLLDSSVINWWDLTAVEELNWCRILDKRIAIGISFWILYTAHHGSVNHFAYIIATLLCYQTRMKEFFVVIWKWRVAFWVITGIDLSGDSQLEPCNCCSCLLWLDVLWPQSNSCSFPMSSISLPLRRVSPL
jgi:hypothetical protein